MREETHYECKDCADVSAKKKCLAGKNWKKPLEERYKKLTVSRLFEELREEEYRLINSEEGKETPHEQKYSGRRGICRH